MKDCQQLLTMNNVSTAFKNAIDGLSDRIISCMYTCYKVLFIKWAKITYSRYPEETIEFLSDSSFTDAILKLKEMAVAGKLYSSTASVKTVLFQFSRNMLLGNLTREKRLAVKERMYQLQLQPDFYIENEITEPVVREHLMTAMKKLDPADRQILLWRHVEAKSNDEIAALLAITVPSATNRIYRCMQRLRDLMMQLNTAK